MEKLFLNGFLPGENLCEFQRELTPRRNMAHRRLSRIDMFAPSFEHFIHQQNDLDSSHFLSLEHPILTTLQRTPGHHDSERKQRGIIMSDLAMESQGRCNEGCLLER